MVKFVIKNYMQVLVVYIILFILWIIFISCKKTYHEDKLQKKQYIFVFWHGELSMMTFLYLKKLKKLNLKINAIMSIHKDGEIIAKVSKILGLKTIRGSTRKKAINVLKQGFIALNKSECIALTPDGPKGPRHEVANGAIVFSQKRQIPFVILNIKSHKYWKFNSWDQFFIPKPFSRLDLYIKEFSIHDKSQNEAKKILKNEMIKNAMLFT